MYNTIITVALAGSQTTRNHLSRPWSKAINELESWANMRVSQLEATSLPPVTRDDVPLDIQGAKGTAKSQVAKRSRLDTQRVMFFSDVRHSTETLSYGVHRMKARACRDINS